MSEKQEIIAKALEIAITLTKDEDTMMRVDENKNVFMSSRLYNNLESVIRIINAKNVTNILDSPGGWVYPDDRLNFRQID